MTLNSTVRWFHSGMAGAPEVRDQPGGLIAVLDACLIHGFDTRTINTLVVAGGVATATISAGHVYEKHAVLRITGAEPADLNGDWRIKDVPDGSSVTFDCPSVADVNGTGTITCKRATPGFWEKPFAAAGKGAYRSTHIDASGLFLRVDDTPTGTNTSPVRGYETMSDVDTGTRPFPDLSQAGTYVWRRTSTVNAASLPRPWTLVADEAFVWLLMHFNATAAHVPAIYFFGDVARAAALDNYPCVVAAHATTTTPLPYTGLDSMRLQGSSNGMFWARPATGDAASPPALSMYGHRSRDLVGDGEGWPATINGGYLFQYPCAGFGGGRYRGDMPGLIQSLTHRADTLGSDVRRILDPDSVMPMAVLVQACTGSASGDPLGHLAFDLFGPWR